MLGDLATLNVEVKVITGDNRFVTGHLAETVGLDPTSMLTGDALAKLDDEALWHVAPSTSLFAEIDPQQKERIVRALQRTGHSVGYLGDGINDAPALHAADVGISVDQAVDVARESADIILLKRDLDVLRTGVEDGRRTFANTLKYISITTSANFGNMVSMAIAAPLLPFLPLVAKQILLNNFLSDVPSMAISTDRVDPERVTHPQRWDIAQVRRYMIVFGLVSSIFDLLTFAALLLLFRAGEATFQTTWFVVSLLTELGVVLILRTRGPAWRSRPSALLLWTTVAATVFALAVPFFGPGSRLFGFVPLSTVEMGTVVGIVTTYLGGDRGDEALVLPPQRPDARLTIRSAASTRCPPSPCAPSHLIATADARRSGQQPLRDLPRLDRRMRLIHHRVRRREARSPACSTWRGTARSALSTSSFESITRAPIESSRTSSRKTAASSVTEFDSSRLPAHPTGRAYSPLRSAVAASIRVARRAGKYDATAAAAISTTTTEANVGGSIALTPKSSDANTRVAPSARSIR